MKDGGKDDKIVAEHNGQVFRFNEVVHVWHQTPPAGGHAYDWWIHTRRKR
jgi:hypothetical protein